MMALCHLISECTYCNCDVGKVINKEYPTQQDIAKIKVIYT